MATKLDRQTIIRSKEAVDTYVSTVRQLNEELSSIITGLVGADFVGDAGDGYKAFYDTKVVPAIEGNVLNETGSIPHSIKDIMDQIEAQLLNKVDPEMGENNKNPATAG